MIETNLEWGESFHDREHSDTLTCPNRECDKHASRSIDYISEEYHASIAIGVRIGHKQSRPYILTCECPGCSNKFWFHITEDEAKNLAEAHKSKK